MNKLEEIFENAINHWRLNKGVGTALIPFPLNDKYMVLGVLQRLYSRSPTNKTTIIVSSFKDRTDIIEFLTTQENAEENNAEFKKLIEDKFIKVLTDNFLEEHYPAFPSDLVILYHPCSFKDANAKFVEWCKFRLILLDKLLSNNEELSSLYKLAPMLEDFKQAEIEQIRLSTPVEETRIPITIDSNSDEFMILDTLNEFIATSITIFGNLDNVKAAYRGNRELNISAHQICYQIAKNNGWKPNLDMYIELDRKIDELYNPISLQERAEQVFDNIRERNNILADYDGKLYAIYDIISKNKDKKFLIINKRADFATIVTDYLNSFEPVGIICMNYHDKVDNVPAINASLEPVYYKSGVNKGQRKMMGAKAQKSLAEALFESGKINVLSANNKPDKTLSGTIDGIILTSPLCDSISSYIYRLSNLLFRNNRIELFTLYCKNTLEEKVLDNKDRAINHSVKNSFQDEDFSDFIVDD